MCVCVRVCMYECMYILTVSFTTSLKPVLRSSNQSDGNKDKGQEEKTAIQLGGLKCIFETCFDIHTSNNILGGGR